MEKKNKPRKSIPRLKLNAVSTILRASKSMAKHTGRKINTKENATGAKDMEIHSGWEQYSNHNYK